MQRGMKREGIKRGGIKCDGMKRDGRKRERMKREYNNDLDTAYLPYLTDVYFSILLMCISVSY